MTVPAEPTCLQRIVEIITAILMLIGGVSSTSPALPLPPAIVYSEYTLRPAVSDYSENQLNEAAEKILRRIELLGIPGTLVEVKDSVIVVRMTFGGDTTDAFGLMTGQGLVEFVDRDGTGEAVVTSADVVSAVAQASDFGDWVVVLTFSESAGETLRQFTRDHVGEVMSIVVDGVTISEPVIQGEIGAEIWLQGNFTEPAARLLAVQIGGGVLPFPMTIEAIGSSS